MNTYDLGDRVPLQHKVYSAGALTSATVTLTVTEPDGTTTSPTVTTSSTGVYNAIFGPTDQLGPHSYVWSVSGAVPDDVVPGQFAVAARAPLAYATLSKLKLKLGISADTTRDELLVDALQAASRYIDKATGRRFWADTATSAKVYRPHRRIVRDSDGDRLLVDDIASATGLVVEIGAVSASVFTGTAFTSYETGPDNALADGRPVTWLLASGSYWTTSALTRIRVTARWGWPSIPDEISEATVLYAARLFRRKDSPEGVTGSADWGAIRVGRVDPDVETLISPFALPGFG